jgi:hypothetical protein
MKTCSVPVNAAFASSLYVARYASWYAPNGLPTACAVGYRYVAGYAGFGQL